MKKADTSFLTPGDGYCDVTLATPAAIGGSKVSGVRMREPTVRDNLVMDRQTGSEADKEILLLANLCELAPDEVQSLTMRNYIRLQQAFRSFLA